MFCTNYIISKSKKMSVFGHFEIQSVHFRTLFEMLKNIM